MKDICTDLKNEQDELDAIVSGLDQAGWDTVTPFFKWTIRDEITHTAYFDYAAMLAATDEEGFKEQMAGMGQAMAKAGSHAQMCRDAVGGDTDQDILDWWREKRSELVSALAAMGKKDRVPWYGPSMSALSHATARMMETWAHGQDVYDTLGMTREPTDRLRHIAHLGVSTFGWAHVNRKLEVPTTPVRIKLNSPSGELLTWGPEDAVDKVSGHVEDFCLVCTQRRNVADTYLEVTGDTANSWMKIAQIFAGPPEDGRPAGMFPKIER